MGAIEFMRIRSEVSMKAVTVMPDGRLRQMPRVRDSVEQDFVVTSIESGVDARKILPRTRGPRWVIDAMFAAQQNAPLQIFPFHGQANQRWELKPTGNNNEYFIHAFGTDLVWDVPHGSTADGVPIQLFPHKPSDNLNQRFNVNTSDRIDAVQIKSKESGQVVDVPGFFLNPIGLQQYPDNGGFNQAWERVSLGGGQFVAYKSVNTGLYLTNPAPGFAVNRGHRARVETGAGFPASRQWKEDQDGDGMIIKSYIGMDVLDLASSSHAQGAQILAYPNNGSGSINQRWEIVDKQWL